MPKTQAAIPSGASETPLDNKLSNFSPVSGGPLYRFWRRTRLSGDALEFARRRVLAMVLITWVPLLLLSIVERKAWGGPGR